MKTAKNSDGPASAQSDQQCCCFMHQDNMFLFRDLHGQKPGRTGFIATGLIFLDKIRYGLAKTIFCDGQRHLLPVLERPIKQLSIIYCKVYKQFMINMSMKSPNHTKYMQNMLYNVETNFAT